MVLWYERYLFNKWSSPFSGHIPFFISMVSCFPLTLMFSDSDRAAILGVGHKFLIVSYVCLGLCFFRSDTLVSRYELVSWEPGVPCTEIAPMFFPPSWQTIIHVTLSTIQWIAPNPLLVFYLHIVMVLSLRISERHICSSHQPQEPCVYWIFSNPPQIQTISILILWITIILLSMLISLYPLLSRLQQSLCVYSEKKDFQVRSMTQKQYASF